MTVAEKAAIEALLEWQRAVNEAWPLSTLVSTQKAMTAAIAVREERKPKPRYTVYKAWRQEPMEYQVLDCSWPPGFKVVLTTRDPAIAEKIVRLLNDAEGK